MGTTFAVSKQSLTFNNIKYFRSHAEDTQIVAFGKKHDPIGAKAYLEVEGHVAVRHLGSHVRYLGRANIDWTGANKREFDAAGAFSYLTVKGSGTSSATYDSKSSAQLDVVKFAIDAGPLRKLLNEDATAAREFLEREGADGRVVSSVFIVMQAELAEGLDVAAHSSGTFAGKVTDALNLEFEADHAGSNGSNVAVTLSPGMTFAYGMHKVSDWNRGRTQIEDLEDDFKGMG